MLGWFPEKRSCPPLSPHVCRHKELQAGLWDPSMLLPFPELLKCVCASVCVNGFGWIPLIPSLLHAFCIYWLSSLSWFLRWLPLGLHRQLQACSPVTLSLRLCLQGLVMNNNKNKGATTASGQHIRVYRVLPYTFFFFHLCPSFPQQDNLSSELILMLKLIPSQVSTNNFNPPVMWWFL